MASGPSRMGTLLKRPFNFALLACGLMAAGAGYVAGASYALRVGWRESVDTPLARLGYTLTAERPDLLEGAPPVEEDVAAAQVALGEPAGTILRLVVALQEARGNDPATLKKPAELCEKLAWSRCDEAALLRMKETLQQ